MRRHLRLVAALVSRRKLLLIWRCRLDRRQHRLSGAARAFKAHALAAATVRRANMDATEDLYSSAVSYDISINDDDTHQLAV